MVNALRTCQCRGMTRRNIGLVLRIIRVDCSRVVSRHIWHLAQHTRLPKMECLKLGSRG